MQGEWLTSWIVLIGASDFQDNIYFKFLCHLHLELPSESIFLISYRFYLCIMHTFFTMRNYLFICRGVWIWYSYYMYTYTRAQVTYMYLIFDFPWIAFSFSCHDIAEIFLKKSCIKHNKSNHFLLSLLMEFKPVSPLSYIQHDVWGTGETCI